MYGADTHRDYHRERHVELVRAASRRDAALELAVARDDERRTYLARAWQRRFRRAVLQTSPVST